MRILQIIPNLGCGGAEHFVCDLAIELNNQGQQCDILTLYDIESDNGILSKMAGFVNVYSIQKKSGFQFSTFVKILKFIRKGEYDIVNAHVAAIKYILLACLFHRTSKYYATIHSDAKFEAGYSIEKFSRIIMFKLKLCKAITISEESNQSFNEFYNVKGNLIYNGVSDFVSSDNHIPIRMDKKDIIFFHPASCQEVKNQRMLFNAFKRLEQLYPNVYLYWAGANGVFLELFKSLEPLITGHIKYIGMVNNVRDYLKEADAMCLSSKIEGMPITIIEAFSVGCVPICTPVGGCKNMIKDGENGILSKEVTEDAYFDALKRFVNLSDIDLLSLKKNSQLAFDKYNIHSCANNYLQLYSSK